MNEVNFFPEIVKDVCMLLPKHISKEVSLCCSGSYINVRYEGYFGYNYDILD